jgi:hypothetical protein
VPIAGRECIDMFLKDGVHRVPACFDFFSLSQVSCIEFTAKIIPDIRKIFGRCLNPGGLFVQEIRSISLLQISLKTD